MDEVQSNNSNLSFYETSVANIFKNDIDGEDQGLEVDDGAEIDFFNLMI